VRSSESPKSTTSKKDSNKKDSNKNKKEDRVTKMVLVMVLVFLVVWSPYAIAVIATVAKVILLNVITPINLTDL
jgi:hypothetical protein